MNTNKKVIIVGLYYHPEMPSRVEMVYSYFRQTYDTIIITSDFVHPTKKYDATEWKDCIKLHVPEYKTNFSIKRVLSHLNYARQINKCLKENKPNLIYICVPPNYSALRAARWARKHKIPSIIDIVDIWPNTNAPSNKLLRIAYKVWSSIKDKAVLAADKVILECSVYKNDIPNVGSTMIPLSKRVDKKPNYEKHDDIRIVYIGAFSTSYDFESLVDIAKEIKEKGRGISISLIGKGDEKNKVIRLLESAGIKTTDYGVIYDEEEKARILETCDFGYNGFKPGMIVGQSYKSLDYMGYGLALINSLQGDLRRIIESENCGLNFDATSRDKIAETIVGLSREEIEEMKRSSFEAYTKHFSWEVYMESMNNVMKGFTI